MLFRSVDFMADGLREKQGKRFKDNVDSLSISLANLFKDKTVAEYKKQLQLAYTNKSAFISSQPYQRKIAELHELIK